jgi:LuxR family transcriptional regulator, maltose regulon positive regulatory protein
MAATAVQKGGPRRERGIIERPRLTKMLDECEARVILLLAPAGYGKTTLARQWVRTLFGAIWMSATPAHRDVATFSEDLAAGIDELGGTAGKFIGDYLSAQSNPQRVARGVAGALADQINKQRAQWIVIDDYHELGGSADIESMVEVLLARTSVRLLVASRARPVWATARRLVYAEMSEIGRDALAMDSQESFALLGKRQDLNELLEQAQGWPAVLALASRLGPTSPPTNAMPQALHQYVADELLQSATELERSQLVELALLPDLSWKSLSEAFGAKASGVARRARDLGFISEQTRELHPLLREFLLEKLHEDPKWEDKVRRAIVTYISRECWDQALDVSKRFGLLDVVQPILTAAYKPLVRSGRIGSLARFAEDLRVEPSLPPDEVDLVDAEVALRDGAYALALQLSSRLQDRLVPSSPLRSRASAIAGGAAFQLADYDRSESAFARALSDAADDVDLNEALHGLAIAAIYGERPSVDRRIDELGQLAGRSRSPLNVARHASSVIARMRIGPGFRDSPFFDDALRVLDQVTDPRARTSVLLNLSYALGLQCEYARSLDLVKRMIVEIETCGFEFARPHAHWNLAFVKVGLRRFREADTVLKSIESTIEQRPLGHHSMNVAALRGRLLMQLARHEEGFRHVKFEAEYQAAPAMHGEYLATRALGFALLGEEDAAMSAAASADALSVASEVHVLAEGARAILAAEARDSDRAAQLVHEARSRSTWDPAVCCVRASPTLASCLAAQDNLRPTLERLYRLSSDRGLARKAGFRSPSLGDPSQLMTPREAEVLELMAQGFRNREIAAAFVISEATVKIHVRHVLEKLGVKSRTQAVARYQDMR